VYVIYITYHVDVGETPFLIAVDYAKKAVVLSIRGTLSLQVRGPMLSFFITRPEASDITILGNKSN
jgi:hypothetical protein